MCPRAGMRAGARAHGAPLRVFAWASGAASGPHGTLLPRRTWAAGMRTVRVGGTTDVTLPSRGSKFTRARGAGDPQRRCLSSVGGTRGLWPGLSRRAPTSQSWSRRSHVAASGHGPLAYRPTRLLLTQRLPSGRTAPSPAGSLLTS